MQPGAFFLPILPFLGISALAEPTESSTEEFEPQRVLLAQSGDAGVHTVRIPGLATSTKGTLLAVFDLRHDSAVDLPGDIDVGLKRSVDDGKTWSETQVIMDYDKNLPESQGNGVGDPTILVDQKTGRIIVAALHSKGNRSWHGSGPGLSADETGQLVLSHSDDDGLTWSEPVSITPQIKNPEWRLLFQGPGAGIQHSNGSLIFPAQFKDAENRPHACFIVSSDGGETWKISPPAISDAPPTSEAQIVELSDGSLLLSMRDESRQGKRAWAKWTWQDDLLQGSWSPHWLDLPDPVCMASIVKHPSGALLFSNPADEKHRRRLTVRSSRDDGKTWNSGRVIEAGGAMYSCLTILRNGDIGILYESGNPLGLTFARIPAQWIESAP